MKVTISMDADIFYRGVFPAIGTVLAGLQTIVILLSCYICYMERYTYIHTYNYVRTYI